MSQAQVAPHGRKARIPSLWRNRDFILLWSGQTISSTGTQISQIAFPLLVLALTHSAAQAGFVGAVRAIPYVVLSLPAGALIDRWNRKRVMLLCDTGRAIALGSVPVALLLGHLSILQIYLVALVEGTLYVFFNIAEVACLPRVVLPEQLAAATAQNEAAMSTSFLIGPLLGGVLYTIRRMLPFAADAVSYAVSVISLLFIRTQFQGERTGPRRALRAEIWEGLAWLWKQPLIRYIAFLTGGLNFTSAGLVLMLIVLAERQNAPGAIVGTIVTIGSVGGIIGALIGGSIQRRFRFGPVIIVTVWIQALLFPLYAVASTPLLLGLISAGIFVAGPVYNVVQFSYRLTLIPDALQGRVNSVFRLMAFGFQPLGYALTGVLIQHIQVVPTVFVFAVVLVGLAIVTTFNPHVRHARPVATAPVIEQTTTI